MGFVFRYKYGRQLQQAIRSFLTDFLQHMKQEEAVFGPLLKENFERKELEDMNETVLKQHSFFREKVRSEKTLVKAVKRKRSGEVFDDLDFALDDLRFKKSYCQEVNDHMVSSSFNHSFGTRKQFLRELKVS